MPMHFTFPRRRDTCPAVHINNVEIIQVDAKYLWLHLDGRVISRELIFSKLKLLGIILIKMYRLFRCTSKFAQRGWLLLYKAISKPIQNYWIQVWSRLPLLKWKSLDASNRKLCLWYWIHFGSSRIRLSKGISKQEMLEKKSAATALNIVLATVYIQTRW
jgi:hypothetical protein